MKSTGSFLAGIIGGAIIGAAIGILFAPEKGEDTRNKLTGAFDDLKQRVLDELEKRGIKLTDDEVEDLVNELEAKAKAKAGI